MTRKVTSVALSMSLWVMSVPASARAPSSESAARLEVDTSDLGAVGPVLKERLLERGAQVFRDENIGPGSAEDPIVRVSVREPDGDEPGFDYEVRLITRAGERGTAWSERCELCTESELIEAVAAELDKVAGSIRALDAAQADEQEDQSSTVPPPVIVPVTSDSDSNDGASQRRLDTKGKVGIGLLALGVAAAAAGTGLVLAPARPLANDPLRERYTQPPGFAALAVGGAALISGAVLLALSLRGRKRG